MSRSCLLFILVGILTAIPSRSLAETASEPKIIGIRIGFDGYYKPGLWTPLEITLKGGAEQLAVRVFVTVPDSDGVPTRYSLPSDEEISLLPGEEQTVRMVVRFGRRKSRLEIECRQGEQVIAHQTFQASSKGTSHTYRPALRSSQRLIVVLASGATGVEEAIGRLCEERQHQTITALLSEWSELPPDWHGYEGVDTVVLSTHDAPLRHDVDTHPRRLEALDQWILMGGKLVFCVGQSGESILKPGSPLSRFAPGRLEKMVVLRQMSALEGYSESTTGVPSPDGQPLEIRVPLLTDVTGTIEAREDNLVLVVRRAHGFGEIVFLAADLDTQPLNEWADREMLVGKLLGITESSTTELDENRALIHHGFDDMAGHLRNTLEHFDGIRQIPFGLIVVLILLYATVIGPGDYFFLRKVARRMTWTWVSFPLVVLFVGVAAYSLVIWSKGQDVRSNQVDLIDMDTESGTLRATSWANVFSPKVDRYHLSFQLDLPKTWEAEDTSPLSGWFGLPGSALGGMDPSVSDTTTLRTGYAFGPSLDSIDAVPIPARSTKCLTSRWKSKIRVFPEADLSEEGRLLHGTIRNTLDITLDQCFLAFGPWAFELGTLEPGDLVRIDPGLQRRELKTILTGRKMVFDRGDDKFRHQGTPYDKSNVDIEYVLRMMSFHDAVDGCRYTQLLHRYQHFVDLSGLLELDRAVLMARPRTPKEETGLKTSVGVRLLRDGEPLDNPQDRHVTIVRFVFPVHAKEKKE